MLYLRIDETGGCCGVVQINGFTGSDYDDDEDWLDAGREVVADSWPDLFQKMNATLTNCHRGMVAQIWFVKYCDFLGGEADSFQAQEFMDLIKGIEGCLDIGTTKNPNTKNIIQGYSWIVK